MSVFYKIYIIVKHISNGKQLHSQIWCIVDVWSGHDRLTALTASTALDCKYLRPRQAWQVWPPGTAPQWPQWPPVMTAGDASSCSQVQSVRSKRSSGHDRFKYQQNIIFESAAAFRLKYALQWYKFCKKRTKLHAKIAQIVRYVNKKIFFILITYL